MAFTTVNVLEDRAAYDRVVALGIRKVPVIFKGAQYVLGRNLDTVAEFVGLTGTGHTALPPDVLIDKWIAILRAAQRYVRQLPVDRLNDRAIEERDRTIRVLSHHVFRIAEAFLECSVDGAEFGVGITDVEPEAGSCTTGNQIAEYGDQGIERLQQWWTETADRSCEQTVQTFYGPQRLHELLERSTWHSAQHARQLMSILQRFGVEPERPLTAQDLAGLPLPEGLD